MKTYGIYSAFRSFLLNKKNQDNESYATVTNNPEISVV